MSKLLLEMETEEFKWNWNLLEVGMCNVWYINTGHRS